jgi:thioredoxin 1
VGKVNIDNEGELAARYRVNAIPALLYFKGGEVRDQVVGGVAKATLLSKLEALG